jgi:hypothetical protein
VASDRGEELHRRVSDGTNQRWKTVGKDGEEMTGSKHNLEGNTGDHGEPDPGPYWRRIHKDWRFWVCAGLMAIAIAVYVFTVDLAFVPHN